MFKLPPLPLRYIYTADGDAHARSLIYVSLLSDVEEVVPVSLMSRSSAISACLASEGKIDSMGTYSLHVLILT